MGLPHAHAPGGYSQDLDFKMIPLLSPLTFSASAPVIATILRMPLAIASSEVITKGPAWLEFCRCLWKEQTWAPKVRWLKILSLPSSHPSLLLFRYSRPSTELDRSDGASGAGGVGQHVLHRDANGDDTHRIRVCLIKHSPQALDSFGCCQRAILGIHSLERAKQGGSDGHCQHRRKCRYRLTAVTKASELFISLSTSKSCTCLWVSSLNSHTFSSETYTRSVLTTA